MMTQNLVKSIIGNVASSYQVNLAIEIPNITENYINLHIFTGQHWVSAILVFKNVRHVVWLFFGWPDIFLFGRLGANKNVSGKLCM